MFHKTDAANNHDAQMPEPIISSPEVKDGLVKLPNLSPQEKTTQNYLANALINFYKQFSWSTKATLFAIAISTLPVLGFGILTYKFSSQSLAEKIIDASKIEAVILAEKINRFMWERYVNVQIISNLSILEDVSLKNKKNKQELLEQWLQKDKIFNNISVFDRQGKLIVTSSGEPPQNPQNQPYFKNSIQEDHPIISGVIANNIYLAAPVKNRVTKEIIGVIVAQMPLKNIEELIKSYKGMNGTNYYLIDDTGQIFAANQQADIGKNIHKEFAIDEKLHTAKKVVAQTIIHPETRSKRLISLASLEQLSDMPNLNWEVMLSASSKTVFAPQKQLLVKIATTTGIIAIIAAAIATWLAKRITKPILQATAKVAKLNQGGLNFSDFTVKKEDELELLNANINQMAVQLQSLLQEQQKDSERAKLLADMTLRIRLSLTIEDICQTAVREIRQALKADRAVICKLDNDGWNGQAIAESVNINYPKMYGVTIDNTCFGKMDADICQNGEVQAIANIYQQSNLKDSDACIKFWEKFAVKASLIAPIFQQQQLVGLLMVHQCDSPRLWQLTEIDLLKHLAMQIGYALEQAELQEELEQAKAIAKQSSSKEREQKEALQKQLLQLLECAETAASGDLSVRAPVGAGEIGTVADFFNSIVESLREIVIQVKTAAKSVDDAIGTNSEAIRQLAREAEIQATEIDRTLDAMTRMTQSIQAVAQSAQQATVIAENASAAAAKSGQAMDSTVQNILHLRETVGETAKKVKHLGESTQQISRVVALINQISLQTNLLAINAGIEAARAGEEAQGFVVIAEEVGELATKATAATREIEQIVENIQRETSEAVQAMEVGTSQVTEGVRVVAEAKNSLNQILEVAKLLHDLVQSISGATAFGVETSQVVSELMKQIAVISKHTSESCLQVCSGLQETVYISQQLQSTVSAFKVY
jgi:twitching motility protein PilJ